MTATTAAAVRPAPSVPARPVGVGGGRLVRFLAGGQPFAFPLDRVAEVVGLGSATATAPRGWIGTLVRNQLPVPIGDLAFLLGVTAQAAARRDMRVIILRGVAGDDLPGVPLYGVTVETVPAVLTLGDEQPEPLPAFVRRGTSALVQSSLIRGDELLLILDPDAINARLAVGVIRAVDGRVSELRALPRRPGGETSRIGQSLARSVAPDPLRRDTPSLLLGAIETADGGRGLVPAVPMSWVQEVRAMQALRVIPHAPMGLAGVIAWRGRCLPVIDLTQRLTGIPNVEGSARRLLIVGPQHGAALGGIIVPGVRGLATLGASPAAAPFPHPDTLDLGLLSAWTQHGDDAVALLDLAACFA